MKPERLQKVLAKAGIASRRAAEQLIVDGKVRVNGKTVRELGTRVNPIRDRVEVNGKRLVAEKPVYYLLHKPREVVTTLDDPEGRSSITDLVKDIPERVFPVGRLDFQTSGVLLLTNDGDMAQALLHPTRQVPKVYAVKVLGKIDERGITALREGVVLDDGQKTAPAIVSVVKHDDKHTWLEVTISEGKNRQVHRMFEAIGRRVLRLARISFAGLTIDGLRAGHLRPLQPSELNELKQMYLNPQSKQGKLRTDGPYRVSGAHDEHAVAEKKAKARRFAAGQARRDDVPRRTTAGAPRRTTADAPRRTSADAPRRTSADAPRRTTSDAARRTTAGTARRPVRGAPKPRRTAR